MDLYELKDMNLDEIGELLEKHIRGEMHNFNKNVKILEHSIIIEKLIKEVKELTVKIESIKQE